MAIESTSSPVQARLQAARDRLDAREVAAAVAIYEEVLASAGDRADVLVRISGDLGSTGNPGRIIELIAPRYDATRHGPAAGMNLVQAYLAVRDPVGAQHLLDVLFALNRPELEERLYGFSNAIADLMLVSPDEPALGPASDGAPPPRDAAKVALVTISKPIWFYGLEPLAGSVLPPKKGGIRRVAFAQLGVPGGYPDIVEAMKLPEDELGRLARAIPVWFAEVFQFSPLYQPFSAVAFADEPDGYRHPMLHGGDWAAGTVRSLVDTTDGGLDYVITGSLRNRGGDYELELNVWEVKKYRVRKQFLARWTPATADAELARVLETLCRFMEWSPYPAGDGVPYSPPAEKRAWLDVLGASLNLFLLEKAILPRALLPPMEGFAGESARLAPSSPIASLAWLTLHKRCAALETPPNARPDRLFDSPLVREAAQL